MNLSFQSATATDVPTIIALAHEIWHKHYPDIITKEQIDYMLSTRYSSEQITSAMERAEQFYLVTLNEKPIGFASIEKQTDFYFLHKFYLLTDNQKQGVGTQFFRFLLQEMNNEKVRLQVNRQNIKAINFYFKNGFVIERAADFDIGNGYYMNDFIMIRKPINQ